MKKTRAILLLTACLPVLSGCVIGTVVGTTAEVAGSAVSITAKATKTSANIATKAVGKASNTVLGDKEDDAGSGSLRSEP